VLVTAGVLIIGFLAFFAASRERSGPFSLAFATFAISLGAGLALIATKSILATRVVPTRIAIGGSHGVGKTVYSNVVATRLAEGESPVLRFTPETLTAQHTYLALKELRAQRFPSRTPTTSIDRYRGTVELLHQPPLSRLLEGRITVELELGDSAGELWDEIADTARRPSTGLIESSFFEYVGESSALLYFIPADALKGDPDAVADQVDDLRSTIQILRSIDPAAGGLLSKPVGIVVSKADLLAPGELQAIRNTLGSTSVDFDPAALDPQFRASIERLEHLAIVLGRQVRAFRGFVISALAAAQVRPAEGDSLVCVEEPVEWAIREILRS
jgi:hypothetical protein